MKKMQNKLATSLLKQANLLSMGLLSISISVHAVEPKSGDNGAAIKKAQGMIRQLSQEKTALEAEKTTWVNEKADLESRLKALEANNQKLAPLQNEVDRYKVGLETLKTTMDTRLDQEQKKQQALLSKHNEVVTKAKAIFADNQLLVNAIQEREKWITECSQLNNKLQQTSLDLLNHYQDKGWFHQLAEMEPLTGIGQVKTEGLVEDYQYQLKQLKITPFQVTNEKLPAPATDTIESKTDNTSDSETSAENAKQQPVEVSK